MDLTDDAFRIRPSLRRLKLFDAVVRCGTIGRAAAEISLAQPSVTSGLAKLEAEFGEALISRGPQGSTPTPAGLILHLRVERMLRQIEASAARLFDADEAQRALALVRNLTGRQIRDHLAVDAAGSFRAAAAALGVAEPTLSQSLQQLKNMVGTPLYRRSPLGLTTTAAGARFASELRVAMSEIDQALDELVAARGAGKGRISLGCLPLMPKQLLVETVNAIIRRYPGVEISLHEDDYASLTKALRDGAVDLVLGALREQLSEEFLHIPLFADPFVLVVRQDHPLLSNAPLEDAQLAKLSWIIPWRNTPRREHLEGFFSRLPRRPHVVIETSSLTMTKAVLEESDCITLLTQSQFQMETEGEHLRVLQAQPSNYQRTVGIIFRRDWLATAVQNAFLKRLVENSSAP